jgi:sulfate adenylyltransferase
MLTPALACFRRYEGYEAETLIAPHGGFLVDLMVKEEAAKKALVDSCQHVHVCSERNACDVELLSVGGFSPLTGFMNKGEYDHVVTETRSASHPGEGATRSTLSSQR